MDLVVDYGCGTGSFTALLAQAGRAWFGAGTRYVGGDASPAMLGHTLTHAQTNPELAFMLWDAAQAEANSPVEDDSADRIFAKLCLNYVSQLDLRHRVMPRLRACLKDTGLLVAVMPNLLPSFSYDHKAYAATDSVDVDVGGFGLRATTYHHTVEEFLAAATAAGFCYTTVLAMPNYPQENIPAAVVGREELNRLTEALRLPPEEITGARRLIYVCGAGKASIVAFDTAIRQFESWRMAFKTALPDCSEVVLPVVHRLW